MKIMRHGAQGRRRSDMIQNEDNATPCLSLKDGDDVMCDTVLKPQGRRRRFGLSNLIPPLLFPVQQGRIRGISRSYIGPKSKRITAGPTDRRTDGCTDQHSLS